jgi:hypothetical protein
MASTFARRGHRGTTNPMDAMEDLLATVFLAAMAIIVVAGIYLYQGL